MRLGAFLLQNIADAVWLGRVTYADGLKQQHYFVEKLLASRKLGSDSTKKHFQYNEAEENRLKKLGADFYRTNRGGLITFHGPGQLIVYPIIDLHSLRVKGWDQDSTLVGVRRYVYLIEETIIKTVHSFGLLDAGRSTNTGVWLAKGMKKIAAVGINVRNGIVSHGLSLNCNADLEWFHQIVPCGLLGKEVTSLARELGTDVSVNDVFPVFCEKLAEVFHFDIRICDPDESCGKEQLIS